MSFGGPGFRPSNEICPVREANSGMGNGQGATHAVKPGTNNCMFCGALIYNPYSISTGSTPPTPEVRKVPPVTDTPAAAGPWRENYTGLIDGLLERRPTPPFTHLERFLGEQAFADGYQAGIDTALDLLVPAMKAIVLSSVPSAPGTLPRSEVEKIIGRVPLRRTLRGWE